MPKVTPPVTHLAFSVPSQERREEWRPALAREVEGTMGVRNKRYSGLWTAGYGVVSVGPPQNFEKYQVFWPPPWSKPTFPGSNIDECRLQRSALMGSINGEVAIHGCQGDGPLVRGGAVVLLQLLKTGFPAPAGATGANTPSYCIASHGGACGGRLTSILAISRSL